MEEREKKWIAITVDDGPDGEGCDAYLEIVQEHGIAITFFAVGEKTAEHGAQLLEMVEAGCEIGNHSMTHGYLTEMSPEEIRAEMDGTREAVARVLPDYIMRFARAPYYAYNETVFAQVGYPLIESAVNEGESDDPQTTRERLMAAQSGDIVLMHCWNKGSITALREMAPKMKQEGWQFVTVSALFGEMGVTPENGVVYKHLEREK